MSLRIAALAMLVASVSAQDVRDERLPGRIARGERDAPTAFVRLREGGMLQVKVGEEWKDSSLDDLSKFLKTFAEEQDKELQKSDKSAYETVPGGAKMSRLFVSIDADPTIPWQNIQWLLTIATEQKYYKFELVEGARKMLTFLPTEKPAEPPMLVFISVHAVARSEKPGVWGGATELRPAEVRYKLGAGADETTQPADVTEYVKKASAALKDAKDLQGATISGQIRAGNKVPFARIFDLMQIFDAEGLANMRLHGAPVPDAAVRAAPKLPFPAKNYDPVN